MTLVSFVVDENFNNNILRGLLLRRPDLDIIRVQDVGLSGVDDPDILQWAAEAGRIIVTHDAETMAAFAYERVQVGLPMPGVLEVKRSSQVGQTIEGILIMIEASFESEWADQVRYLIA